MSTGNRLLALAERFNLQGPTTTQPSIVLKDRRSGAMLSLNPDLPFYPACMIKVPLALAIAQMFHDGRLSADTQFTVGEEQMTDTNPPAPYRVGSRDSIMGFIRYALTFSDNVATNVLLDNIDRDVVTKYIHRLGMARTHVRRKLSGGVLIDDRKATGRNEHTAADAVRAFDILARRETRAIANLAWFLEFPPHAVERFGLVPGDRALFKEGYTNGVTHYCVHIQNDDVDLILAVFTGMPYVPENTERLVGFTRAIRVHAAEMVRNGMWKAAASASA